MRAWRDWEGAIRAYREAIAEASSDTNDEEIWSQVMSGTIGCLISKGRREEALIVVRELLARRPKSREVKGLEAELLRLLGSQPETPLPVPAPNPWGDRQGTAALSTPFHNYDDVCGGGP